MPPDVKKFFIVLGSFLLVAAIAFTAIGAYVYQCGVLVVEVDEGENGSNISIRIPAALVHGALKVLPDEAFEKAAVEIKEYGPLVHAVCEELADAPDFVLLEVREGDEAVRIRKHDGKLEINIRDDDERVHVIVPLRMVRSVVHRIEAAQKSA